MDRFHDRARQRVQERLWGDRLGKGQGSPVVKQHAGAARGGPCDQDREQVALGGAARARLSGFEALRLERGSWLTPGVRGAHRFLRSGGTWARGAHGLERRLELALGKARDRRQARHHHGAPQARHRAEAELDEARERRLDPLLARAQAVGGAEIAAEAADEVGEGVLAARERLVEAGTAARLPEQLVRVELVRQRADAHVHRLGEERLDGAVGRALARGVAVEEEDDLVGKALEDPRVLARQRGAEGGDRVGHARLVACDDVGIALADDRGAGVDDRLLRQVDAVEPAALVEDAALRAVEVLGLVLGVDLPGAEGDGRTHLVADREDDPVAEAVDWPLSPVADESRGAEHLERRHGVVALRAGAVLAQALEVAHERVPPGGRGAEAEALLHGLGDAACGDRGAGGGASLGMRERLAEPRGGNGVGAHEGASRAARALVGPRLAELDARALRQRAQRVDELHLVVVHHEVDGVPGGAAGEALVEARALVGDHGHRRRSVVVEGAQPDVLAALGLQLHVLADERRQVGGVEHEVPVGLSERVGHGRSFRRVLRHVVRPVGRGASCARHGAATTIRRCAGV